MSSLLSKPAVEWTPAETAQFLSSIGLGSPGKALAAYVEAQEVPGYMLLANSTKAEDLVEMFGAFLVRCCANWLPTSSHEVFFAQPYALLRMICLEGHLSIGRARAIIFQLDNNFRSKSDPEDEVPGGRKRKKAGGKALVDFIPEPKRGKAGKKNKKRGPRAPTAYLIFCTEKRQQMVAEGVLPAGKGEAMKALGAAWSNLPEEHRVKYVNALAHLFFGLPSVA